MKKTLSSLIAAGLIVNAVPTILPMNTASAAMVTKATVKVVVNQKNISLNGIDGKFATIVFKGNTLYSAKDIAASFKAKYYFDKKTKSYVMTLNNKIISFKANNAFAVVNNKKVTLNAPVATYKGQMYLQIDPIVRGLGGDFIYNPQTKELYVSTASLIKGNSSDAKWIDANHVMFTNEINDRVTTTVLDVRTKAVKQFDTADMVVSPDGTKAVYDDVNDSDHAYLLDLNTGMKKMLNSDDSAKKNFVWSADGTKIYFIHGDKEEGISVMSAEDGTITKLVTDNVQNKSDLTVSEDGKKLIYTCSKQAVTTYTDSTNSEVADIVVKDTEPQLYMVDLTASKPAPTAITTSTENKFFANIQADGSVIYLGEDTNDATKMPTLYKISQDGKTEDKLVENKQIEAVKVSAKGNVYLLVTEKTGATSIYMVTGNDLVKKATTKKPASDFSISADEKQFVLTVSNDAGDHVELFKNGFSELLTKN